MIKMQIDVEEFHRACDIHIASEPGINRPELRSKLIEEESKELLKAIDDNDIVAAIDGMCDLIYVVLGTAAEFGIDLEPFWNEVHRSNMEKLGGEKRADGKQLKPDGWEPPDIEGILMSS